MIATNNIRCTTLTIYVTSTGKHQWGNKSVGPIRKGQRERTSDGRVCSRIVAPTKRRTITAVTSPAMSWAYKIITPSPGATITKECRRMAITTYFLEAMDAPPTIDDSEMAAWIRKEFNMSVGSLNIIKRVLVDVRVCARDGVEYDPSKISSNRSMLSANHCRGNGGRIWVLAGT